MTPQFAIASEADQFQRWLDDYDGGGSQAWQTHWYYDGTTNGKFWLRAGEVGGINRNNTPMLSGHRAWFVNARVAKPNRFVKCPWLP